MLFSVAVFLVVGVSIYAGVYYLTPLLVKKGVPKIIAFWASLWVPVFMLIPVALIHYRFVEGGSMSLEALIERFRFHPLESLDVLWVSLAILGTVVVEATLQPISRLMAKVRWLAPPSYLEAPFNPLKTFTFPPERFFGVRLRKRYGLLIVFMFLHVFAMLSEEVMWRGYLLPMQIEVFGDIAWLINGLMWAWLVHLCLKWHFVAMLPSMLLVPFIAQTTGTTWAAFFVHAVPNALLWIVLFAGVIRSKQDVHTDEPLSE